MTAKNTKLILVRHGQTVWNHERRIQGGSSDTPLSKRGQDQVKELGLSLKNLKINTIYSSPLQRAIMTAQAIAGHHDLTVNIVPNLRELEVGQFEGMSIEGLTQDFSSFLLEWREGDGRSKLPGGESLADLQERTWGTVQKIVSGNDGTVVMVSHYFAILSVICAALELPIAWIRKFRIQPASKSILEFTDGRPRLTLLGDTCHIKEV